MNWKLAITKFIPDKLYLQLLYFKHFKHFINFKNPQTFNEKIQWMKLYNRNPQYTKMVDKYEAKKYVAEKIGDEYIIPTLGVWDSPEEIDFDSLPNQFVLKWNHDSGSIVICKDKSTLDRKAALKKMQKGKKFSGYWYGREWQYKDVKPRIIAEQYMEDDLTKELRDYKFFTFNGEAKVLYISTDRQNPNEETKFDFFDMQFNHLDLINGHPNALVSPEKPRNFDEMKRIAEKLSQGMPFLRVDLYEINGRVYFGELTLSHMSGFVPFEPSDWDQKFGEWIILPRN